MKLRHSIPFIVILLFFSCSKPEEGRTEESFDNHPTWTDSNPDAFWDKQMVDTTINF